MTAAWRWVVADGPVRVGVTTSRRELTTSTVVLADGRALLVDPAWDSDELAGIADTLARLNVTVVAGFATHAHHDHVLWHPDLGRATRSASLVVADICAAERDALVGRLGADWPPELAGLVGRVVGTDGPTVAWPGPAVELITHDAHAPGHTALWLPDLRVLVAGDMLSDVELPLLEDSTSAQYAAGLEVLRPYALAASVLIPGHGRPTTGVRRSAARWRADRDYLNRLVAGTDPADPRLSHPGMADAHAANAAAVRAGR